MKGGGLSMWYTINLELAGINILKFKATAPSMQYTTTLTCSHSCCLLQHRIYYPQLCALSSPKCHGNALRCRWLAHIYYAQSQNIQYLPLKLPSQFSDGTFVTTCGVLCKLSFEHKQKGHLGRKWKDTHKNQTPNLGIKYSSLGVFVPPLISGMQPDRGKIFAPKVLWDPLERVTTDLWEDLLRRMAG